MKITQDLKKNKTKHKPKQNQKHTHNLLPVLSMFQNPKNI